MEEEDLLINSNKPIKEYDDLFTSLQSASQKKFAGATPGAKVYGYDTPLAKSKYDKDLLPDIQLDKDDFFKSLESYRATVQPTSHKLGNALGRLTNIVPEAIGSVASALDFEDYFNSNDEVGNWITDITEKWKKATSEALPIYRQDPGQPLDFSDEGWWIENGSALVQSIGGFAIGGGAIVKGLTGLSKLTKAKKIATSIVGLNRAERIGEIAQTGITATMLNQSEAILEATQVYDDIYKQALIDYNDKGEEDAEGKARQKAADAASATVNANRLNILLNLTSANLFLRTPRLTRNLLTRETTRRNLGIAGVEGAQESAEELINFISGEYGRAKGKDKKYGFEEILKDLGRPEAAEAALLGFFGGLGQTVITKEGVNRFRQFTDPNTGEKISVRDYNKQAYDAQQELIQQYDNNATASNVKTFTDAFNNLSDNIELYNGYKKALEDGNDTKAEEFRQLTLNNQAYNAFKTGTTEALIQMYEELSKGEQKEGMGSDYRTKASDAIHKIKKLEKFYNDASRYNNHQEVYVNRAHNYDLVKQSQDVTSEISEAESDLQTQLGIIAEGTAFDVTKPSETYFFDTNNIDFNPAKEAGDKKGIKDYDKIKKSILDSPYYKNLQALKDAKKTINKRLRNNIDNYSKITSPEYQNAFKKRQEDAAKEASKQINKQVKRAEDDIKKDEDAAKKENLQARRDELKKAAKDRAKAAKDKAEETNEALNRKADSFNVGEKTALDDIAEEHADKVGTITDVKENEDGSKTVTIETEDGEIIKTEDVPVTNKEEVRSAEGPEVPVTSNEDSINNSLSNDIKNNNTKNKSKLSGVKLMSTQAFFASDLKTNVAYKTTDDKVLPGIPQAFLDYERNGANKKGTKITFEINTDINPKLAKAAEFKKAILLLEKAKAGEVLSKEDKNLMVDYLPLKVKVNESDEIYTFLISKPSTDNKDALQAYNNRSRALRISIVKALIDGNNIETLSTTIKGQYGGQLNLAPKGTENKVLDLQGIDGDISKAPLYVVNEDGILIDTGGNNVNVRGKSKPNWKGAVYTKIKKANGDDFFLSLNYGKVTKPQATAIFNIYKHIFDADIRHATPISKLPTNVQNIIKRNLKPETELIQTLDEKPFNDITISELLDLIFWDGSETEKSILNINYENNTINFGPNTYKSNEFTDDVKDEFINWVTTNKNRNFKFRSKSGDSISKLNSDDALYVKYVFDTNLLTTDVDTSGPNFKGFTNLYINNAISGVTKIKEVVKPATQPKKTGFNPSKDTNMRFANIDGTNYHASLDSGKVFAEKQLKLKPNVIPTLEQRMGDIIVDNDIIAKVEASIRANPFVPAPNASLKRYDKKSEEKALNSKEKIVSLQENDLTTENEDKPVEAKRTPRKKLSHKERKARAMANKNNKLNKNCKK